MGLHENFHEMPYMVTETAMDEMEWLLEYFRRLQKSLLVDSDPDIVCSSAISLRQIPSHT